MGTFDCGIRRLAPAAAAIIACLCGATSAWAALEEITVTARKVEESLKDVPLSITAFDSNTIEAAGITNLQDVADLTPGLTFFNAFGENLPVPIIRGVAQTDIFGEPNAAIFVDGVYVAGREGLNFSQLDIERIEVVKGPQSAMYGRTAFSGALNYVTKRPSEVFESKADLEVGNNNKQKASIMLSGPLLGEKLRGRISALYDDWDGSYNNSNHPDTEIGGRTFRSIQGSLGWYPSDTFEANLSVYSSSDDIDDAAVIGLSANCENQVDDEDGTTHMRLLNYCGELPKLAEVPSPAAGLIDGNSMPKVARATGEDRHLTRANLNLVWTPDFGTVTSLTGYSKTKQSSISDFGHLGDYIPYLYCNGAAIENPGSPNSCFGNPADQMFLSGVLDEEFGGNVEEISQEIRFTSLQDQRFRYTAGGYFYSSEQKSYDGGIINQASLPAEDIGLPPFDPSAPNFAIGTAIFYCGFTDDGCLDPLRRPRLEIDNDAWAVFTGVDFDFTDRLIGRAELRYGEQKESVSSLFYTECSPTGLNPDCGDDYYDLRYPGAVPFNPADPSSGSNFGSDTFYSVTGRLGLDYRLNDEWMIYGSVATGDKPGGIQLASVNVVTASGVQPEAISSSYDSEEITAYEIGMKGRNSDGRLSLDVAFYYNDWKDIVLRQIVETSPGSGLPLEQPTAFNINAGTAEVWGWEMTGNVQFTDNLTGRLTVNWNKATLTEARQDTFETFPSFAPDGDVSNNDLLRQPEWTSSASLSYVRPLAGDWEAFARADANYTDKIYIGNDNQSWLPDRIVTNLRFGAESGRYSIAVWVRNLFDDDEPVAAFRDIFWSNTSSITPPYADLGPRPNFDSFVPIRYTVTYPTLRTFGITATVRFGGEAD